MKELLEAGVHFGHYTRRWNPKMRPYIFTERNGIHILDLQLTVDALSAACGAVRDITARGGTVLFLGTKKQAAEIIRQEAERVNMPYVTERWLGGMLTNWQTIRKRIDYLLDLEARRERGEFSMLLKKEVLLIERQIAKLERRLGGIKRMTHLPDMLYLVDARREEIAVSEAARLGIPVVAMVDTNGDPDLIDFVIPSNDDAIRAIKLVTATIADAVEEGLAMRQRAFVDEIIQEQVTDIDTSQRLFDPFEEQGAEEEELLDEAADIDDVDVEGTPRALAPEAKMGEGAE
jgi:small subunit ribosomal protein S2